MNPRQPHPNSPAEHNNNGNKDIKQPPVPPDRAPDVIPQDDPPRPGHREPPPMIT